MEGIRTYGSDGPPVVLLHGGPGAPGHMAPVARELSARFRVLEPFQRRAEEADGPLTVAIHVADLHALIESRCPDTRPALVGSSWGAMLALAYAAKHPDRAGPLVLVGCGTFDAEARRVTEETRTERMDDAFRRRLEQLPVEFPDPDARLRALGELLAPLDSCELASTDLELETCDARGFREAWDDMQRLQREGVHPAAFAAIESPVLMLHGALDPHPGRLIRASLQPHLPQLEYHEWERCGHYPWLEKEVRAAFFEVLGTWLARREYSPRP